MKNIIALLFLALVLVSCGSDEIVRDEIVRDEFDIKLYHNQVYFYAEDKEFNNIDVAGLSHKVIVYAESDKDFNVIVKAKAAAHTIKEISSKEYSSKVSFARRGKVRKAYEVIFDEPIKSEVFDVQGKIINIELFSAFAGNQEPQAIEYGYFMDIKAENYDNFKYPVYNSHPESKMLTTSEEYVSVLKYENLDVEAIQGLNDKKAELKATN